MTWQTRDDSVPGKIYLMRAIGYGGIIPGCLIGRYKVGLSRNPEARLDQLLSAQPCCDIEIIHTVDVNDMAETEADLHEIFKSSNVKLVKSQEWFNFTPWQVQRCIWLMNQADINECDRRGTNRAFRCGDAGRAKFSASDNQNYKSDKNRKIGQIQKICKTQITGGSAVNTSNEKALTSINSNCYSVNSK